MTAYKMTPDRLKRIYEAIELGLPYKLAAQYGGITESCFHQWKARAAEEAEPGPYTEFLRGIEAAEGRCAVRCMVSIQTAAKKGNWQAAAWTLERRFDAMRMPSHREESVMREIRAAETAAERASTDPRAVLAELPASVLRELLAAKEAEEG